MTIIKPTHPIKPKGDRLPTDRHFDCMKKCPLDCNKYCKRLAYPRLVNALKELTEQAEFLNANGIDINYHDARALLHSLGEEE